VSGVARRADAGWRTLTGRRSDKLRGWRTLTGRRSGKLRGGGADRGGGQRMGRDASERKAVQ
jgi:hypothetical protein